MIRILSFLMVCIFIGTSASAQVDVKEDFPIDMMMRRYAEINNSRETIPGWQIQIMAKTDRLAIERAKEDFMLAFPGVSVDWTHSKPYYRLKVGAFQTKLEAVQMVQQIKGEYAGAFPVKANISKRELLPEF